MNYDLVEYERLRKLCDKYKIKVYVSEAGITLSPNGINHSIGVKDLDQLDIYLIGFSDGCNSQTKEIKYVSN